jgi:hypothetical protein
MNNKISSIENDVQDRNSVAWKKLCEYVDFIAAEGKEEFSPREYLGEELFAQIHTLPESIAKLKKVKKVWLYGSKLKRIPPQIGQMEALEYFDPYTSYQLHWFPYEITKCKHLKYSRISTRALYGNYKNRMGFPRLDHNPVRYIGEKVRCSVCDREMTYEQTNQVWITLRIATDTVPLLANLCSQACQDSLPKPPENYVSYPHKGGADLIQPLDENQQWEIEMAIREKEEEENKPNTETDTDKSDKKVDLSDLKPLKVIKKIWEK